MVMDILSLLKLYVLLCLSFKLFRSFESAVTTIHQEVGRWFDFVFEKSCYSEAFGAEDFCNLMLGHLDCSWLVHAGIRGVGEILLIIKIFYIPIK